MTAEGTATRKPATSRAMARERTLERIVALGNVQLVEHGLAGLSVREIARGLGMVSSAVYRYVSSRDELLTLLIVDAYADLADAVDAAISRAGASTADDPRARLLALGDAMSTWAIAQPERWTLLYGTPVRDYSAPAAITTMDGTRVMREVLRIAADAAAQGVGASGEGKAGPREVELDPEVTALLEIHLVEFDIETTPATEFAALTVWSSLVGVISAHVFGQLGPDAAAIGERILDSQIRMLADLLVPC